MGLAGLGSTTGKLKEAKALEGSLGWQTFCLLRAYPEPSSLQLPNSTLCPRVSPPALSQSL